MKSPFIPVAAERINIFTLLLHDMRYNPAMPFVDTIRAMPIEAKLAFGKAGSLAAACTAMPLAILCVDRLAPQRSRELGQCVGHRLVLPIMDRFLPIYDRHKRQSLSDEAYGKWKALSPDQKATEIACELLHDGVNLATGIAAGYGGATATKHFLRTNISEKALMASEIVDGTATLGALAALDVGFGHRASHLKSRIGGLLERNGIRKDTAQCAANSLVSFGLPEAVGSSVSLAYLLTRQTLHR